jgi:hypothetical protein
MQEWRFALARCASAAVCFDGFFDRPESVLAVTSLPSICSRGDSAVPPHFGRGAIFVTWNTQSGLLPTRLLAAKVAEIFSPPAVKLAGLKEVCHPHPVHKSQLHMLIQFARK